MEEPMKASLYVGILAVACLTLAATANAGDYIVVLKDGVHAGAVMNPTAAAAARRAVQAAAKRHRAVPAFVYAHALRGYAATLSDAALARAQADPAVAFVAEDGDVTAADKSPRPCLDPTTCQVLPTGIDRIDGDRSSTRSGNGRGSVNINVAILDSGIDTDHPDLNVVGGTDCVKKGSKASFDDPAGHGTHVAGIVGGKDNGVGVVGVAPGAPLWAVRVLDADGFGKNSEVICGIDWVTSTRTDPDPTNDIVVANMSLGGEGSDDGNCGNTNKDATHLAICHSV